LPKSMGDMLQKCSNKNELAARLIKELEKEGYFYKYILAHTLNQLIPQISIERIHLNYFSNTAQAIIKNPSSDFKTYYACVINIMGNTKSSVVSDSLESLLDNNQVVKHYANSLMPAIGKACISLQIFNKLVKYLQQDLVNGKLNLYILPALGNMGQRSKHQPLPMKDIEYSLEYIMAAANVKNATQAMYGVQALKKIGDGRFVDRISSSAKQMILLFLSQLEGIHKSIAPEIRKAVALINSEIVENQSDGSLLTIRTE